MPRKPMLDRAEDRAEVLAKRGKRLIEADRYVVVLALLGLVIITNAFLVQGSTGLVVMLAMLMVTLIVTLVTSEAGWGITTLAGTAIVIALIAGFTMQAAGKVGDSRLAYQLAVLAIGLTIGAVIVRRIVKHPQVSVDTVAGAASIYLLLGLLFAVAYALVGDIIMAFGPAASTPVVEYANAAQAFFVSARTPVPSDFLYYSFVTLTTVGYGDVTASTQFGRMLSVCEALIGQLYLVTVVAILVSNLRSGPKKTEAKAASVD